MWRIGLGDVTNNRNLRSRQRKQIMRRKCLKKDLCVLGKRSREEKYKRSAQIEEKNYRQETKISYQKYIYIL